MTSPQSQAWWKQPGVSPWVPELIRVRSVGLSGLKDLRRSELPLLKAKALQHYPSAGSDPTALRSLLHDIANRLPDDFQEAARYEFGLITVPGVDRQTSAARRESAAAAMYVSYSAFRHDDSRERALLEETAALLERLHRADPPSVPADFATPYIDRPLIHADIELAVDETTHSPKADQWQRRGVIIVRGEQSSGASRTTYEHFKDRDAVRLPAQNEAALLAAVCATLEREKQPVGGDASAIRHQFAKLLKSTHGPDVVIFDDVADSDTVLDWLPERLRTLVVVVTHALTPDTLAPIVHIGAVADDHALIELVTHQCDITDEKMAYRVGALAGRRIGVIAVVGRIARELNIDVPTGIVELLTTDLIPLLDAATDAAEEPLTTMYTRATIAVAEDHRASMRLLIMVAHTMHHNLTARALAALSTDDDLEYSMTPSGQVAFLSAMRPLLRLGLVRKETDRYFMDPLTARVVRSLTAEGFPSAFWGWTLSAVDKDHHVRSLLDLLQMGWSAADIAAYLASVCVILQRADPDLLDEGYTGTGLRKEPGADLVASETGNAVWEAMYFMARFIEHQSPDAERLRAALEVMPRPTLTEFLNQWRRVPSKPDLVGQEFVELLAGKSQELAKTATDEEVKAWAKKMGFPQPKTPRQVAATRRAYVAYLTAMAGTEQGLDLARQLDEGGVPVPDWLQDLSLPDFPEDEEESKRAIGNIATRLTKFTIEESRSMRKKHRGRR